MASQTPIDAQLIAVIGAGPVGLVTATYLANHGHRVTVVESSQPRREAIEGRTVPFHEPDLQAQLDRAWDTGNFDVRDAIENLHDVSLAILCVGTPQGNNGSPDLAAVWEIISQLPPSMSNSGIVVLKSTVPPGTTDLVAEKLHHIRADLRVVSCPEFLREGNAVADIMHPSRLIVGGTDPVACQRVATLFKTDPSTPVITSSAVSAELIKYGSNAFLATKISFINEMAHLCDLTGGDVVAVAAGMGADSRIGPDFLRAGLGFGGSCFPKDVRGLETTASGRGYRSKLLEALSEINEEQRARFISRIVSAMGGSIEGKRIAVLGLAFKPHTDDVRQSPAIDVVNRLLDARAHVAVADPVALDRAAPLISGATLHTDPYECVSQADAVVLATEWTQYTNLAWDRVLAAMNGDIVFDGRNVLDQEHLSSLGFQSFGIGRPAIMARSGK